MYWYSHEIPVMNKYGKDGINMLCTCIARPVGIGCHDTVLINQWLIYTAVHPWDDSWWNSHQHKNHNLHRRILFLRCYNILPDIHYLAIIKPYNWLKLLGRGAYCICWCGVLADSDVMRWRKRLLPFAKCLNQMRHFQWDGWCRAKLSVFSWQACQAAKQHTAVGFCLPPKLSMSVGVIEVACKMEMPTKKRGVLPCRVEIKPQTSNDVFLTARWSSKESISGNIVGFID